MEKIKPGDMSTDVENVVITCMDKRYQRAIRDLLMEKHEIDINDVDRLAIGGSSKAVADGTLTPSLNIAFAKHNAKNVYIFDHIDCGGFGGQEAFDNDVDKETQAHFESLDAAQEAIHQIVSEVVVVTYVIGPNGRPIDR